MIGPAAAVQARRCTTIGPASRHFVRPGHLRQPRWRPVPAIDPQATPTPEPDIGADWGTSDPWGCSCSGRTRCPAFIPGGRPGDECAAAEEQGYQPYRRAMPSRSNCGSSSGLRRRQPASDEPCQTWPDGGVTRRRTHPGGSRFPGAPFRGHGRARGNGATSNPTLRCSTERVGTRPGAIGNALRARGWLPGRDIVVLSDGDPALVECVRSAAGDNVKHILDWFHISMRVRHVEQALAGLLGRTWSRRDPFDTSTSTSHGCAT